MIALVAGPHRPPRFAQGLGLPSLAAVLEAAGLPVRVFDLYPPGPETDDPAALDRRLAAAIAQCRPALVGVTIHTPAYTARVRLAHYLRQQLPGALLVAGGHHPTAEPVHLLRHSDFDVCVVGEGEETLLELARRAVHDAGVEGTDPTGGLRAVRGVAYKQDGQIVRTPPRPPVAAVDTLPFPAHHLLGLEYYAPHPLLGIRSQGILTYRGCPLACAYCLNPLGRRVRQRDPAKVAEEMARVGRDFGVRGFNCYDNLFGLDRAHALAVCEEIGRRRLDVVWECWTAGDLVDAELARAMRAAGCVRVGFGAESGDDGVLARTRRGFTVHQHQAGIRALQAAGLRVAAYFMVGLPGESAETVNRTVAFAQGCGAAEVALGVYRPYPGTAIWRHPGTFGVRLTRGPDFEAYVETESLSRAALVECAQRAGEELRQGGLTQEGVWKLDRYDWE